MNSQRPEAPRRLLFVVGLTRSGTSLLYALLNQHPDIALMYEADAVYLDVGGFDAEELGRMEFWNRALSRHGFSRATLADVHDARSFYEVFARHKDARIHGEKSPSYCAHLPRIAARFPDARFLIIRRDFADVYRSVLDAARHRNWWGRPGAFHRLLREQEVMLRDVRTLSAQGVPVHCVDYAELVRDAATVMQSVSQFLQVEFCSELVTLHGADLSSVHSGPEHSHLQGREIGLRKNPTQIPPGRAACIARFQARWDQLDGRTPRLADAVAPVGRFEFSWHQMLGGLVVQFRYCVRRIYDIAPPPALSAYRELKHEVRRLPHVLGTEKPAALVRRSIAEVTLIAGMLAVCAWLNAAAGPYVTFAPFYLVPVIYAVRRFNVVAALVVSLMAAIIWSTVHLTGDTAWQQVGLLVWNTAMRFVVFAIFTLLAGAGGGFVAASVEARKS